METPELRYPRRILLAVTGLTPQVVTETLYALRHRGDEALPTEIHLLSTAEGIERARLTLLSDEPGWFHRLRRDYALPAMQFDECCLHVLKDGAGRALTDIRTESDNIAAADAITDWIRHLTGDDASQLHVSLAGGRKTMGFYAGYALSLYGRSQDRLSHVLVMPPYESHPDFFYPTMRVLRTVVDPPAPMNHTRTSSTPPRPAGSSTLRVPTAGPWTPKPPPSLWPIFPSCGCGKTSPKPCSQAAAVSHSWWMPPNPHSPGRN